MDDVEFRWGEEEQCSAQLLRKLAREVEWHASKVSVAQEIIEIVGEELKDEAEVGAKHKVSLQPYYRQIYEQETKWIFNPKNNVVFCGDEKKIVFVTKKGL